MSQVLLHYRRQDLPRLFILRDSHLLRVPRVGFVGEGVRGIHLAGVQVCNGNAARFGGGGAIGLSARVRHHHCLVEIVIEIFVLFLPRQSRNNTGATSVILVSNLVWKPNSEVL
jgi:hypothetical protein